MNGRRGLDYFDTCALLWLASGDKKLSHASALSTKAKSQRKLFNLRFFWQRRIISA